MKKRIVLFFLILFFLIGFILITLNFNKKREDKEINLKNKENCLRYKNDFEKYLEEKSINDSYYSVNKIFYSKKRNTCLGAYTCSINKGDFVFGNVRMATGYCWGIRDLLELEDIYWDFQKAEEMTKENNGFIRFNEVIKENQ